MRLILEPAVALDRDARAVVAAAQGLAQSADRAATPARLLHTMLQDRAVRRWWGEAAPSLEGELERFIATEPAARRPLFGRATSNIGRVGELDVHATTVVTLGAARSARRALKASLFSASLTVSRGDLLWAMMQVKQTKRWVETMPRLVGVHDREDPPEPAGAFTASGAAGRDRWLLVLDDDDVTPMPAVVDVLTEALGMSTPRAVVTTQRVHSRGAAIADELPTEEAIAALARCREAAREKAPQLRIRLAPAR